MLLHEVLVSRRDEVFQRWRARVSGALVDPSTPHVELLDHLPVFLDGIIEVLRDPSLPRGPLEPAPGTEGAAAVHGAQRLRLGFSLAAVVREYGVLRDAIVLTAREAGVELTLQEHDVITGAIISGIAEAVSEYSRQRDAELARQTNEHFAFIAHELRNPLASASNALAVLKARDQLPVEVRSVAVLERGLRRAVELVDQTLHVARAASGIVLREEWTTVSELLADAELAVSADAELKGVHVSLGLEPNQERVRVDTRLVRSALVNLASNAVKYTPSGGHVVLRGRAERERLVFEVEDSCGGLPPNHVDAAFAPFVRLEESGTGFGLGLAIAKQAMEAHGGTIRVENDPGKGCRFILEMPHGGSGAAAI